MRTPNWVQTVACTQPVLAPKPTRWTWTKIFDGTKEGVHVQIWVCKQDLKENFVQEAKRAFGTALDQCVRLGNTPEVLFPKE